MPSSSNSECKTWALRFCRGFSVDEHRWLQAKDRSRHSNWMCHAGVFGLFKAIYEGTGHRCEPNQVAHLKETLSEVTRAMCILFIYVTYSRSAINLTVS